MEISFLDVGLVFLIIFGALWGISAGGVRAVGPFAFILAVITLARAYPDISARFGAAPRIHFFLLLLLVGFGVLLIFGLLMRALHAAVHASGFGPLNRLLGLGLGLLTGTVIASTVVWWIQSHGGPQVASLLSESVLSPALREFFDTIVAFTERLLPPIQAKPAEPWWKRSLW